ncbi:DegT/DnrJ/EryC1/StrS aminotransferase family protein [Vibrio cholerae]|uniref:DegT/DnrJ/EryC1/StrS family aminotransferase n=1 Tax=Vibrio cholerae TaxID=666 RepID=UPI00115BC980|nr:DegT/DnrJ/EryC1/StrS aminotransferase family protein [Vibrio cholerae]TQQ48038.1 DegT/DnrJ/EryC1/StrS aminotransferase family protein [Vibrio cholerae]
MLNTGFSPWPSYSEEEVKIISDILRSNRVNYWTGEHGKSFEKEFAAWCGTKYAVALSNGTVALEVALRAMGIGPGDEVITTPRTFLATASAIVAVGARPVFADVELVNQNISARTITDVISPVTKAIIVVHLAGLPAEMDEIMSLADEHDLYVIEDCAQAHGAKYKGKSVGSIGHVGCWSFCQDKIMTTAGEGGMITTDHQAFYEFIWSYKDHGKNLEKVLDDKIPRGKFRWLHDSFGSNFRMTEIQAAIGRYQLNKVNEWCNTRRKYMGLYDAVVDKFSFIRKIDIPDHVQHAGYKYYMFVNDKHNVNIRDRILQKLIQNGIPAYEGSCSEIYLENAFHENIKPSYRLKNAEILGRTSIMLLVHPSLTDAELYRMCDILNSVLLEYK